MGIDSETWKAAARDVIQGFSGVEREILEKQFLPSIASGWLCPACGRGNAPTTATCPCKPWPKQEVTS